MTLRQDVNGHEGIDAELYRTRVLDGQFNIVDSSPIDNIAGILGTRYRNTIGRCTSLMTRFTRHWLWIRIVQCTAVIMTAALPVRPEKSRCNAFTLTGES